MLVPFVSIDLKLWRVAQAAVQREEVLDVPGVDFAGAEGCCLLDEQRFWTVVGFGSVHLDELHTEGAAVANEEPGRGALQCLKGDHAWGPRSCAYSLEVVAHCMDIKAKAQECNWFLLLLKLHVTEANSGCITMELSFFPLAWWFVINLAESHRLIKAIKKIKV